jgi:nephrocystin-4
MDPAFMKPGETQLFLQHLSQQTMYIDVWDGDSLLPLGSTAVDLKVILEIKVLFLCPSKRL